MTKTPTKTTQESMEILFSKHQLLPVLREQFAEMASEYPIEEDHQFVAEVLSQMYLHRQCDPETLVGILYGKYGSDAQLIADKLIQLCEFDYLDYNGITNKFVVKYDISKDVQSMLDRYQYPLPMVVKPEKVKNNLDTGYQTIRGSVVLNGSEVFKGEDLCLDHLNRANSVALALDLRVIESEEGKYIKPIRHQGEDFHEFNKRVKQSAVFYDTSLEVMEGLLALTDEIYLTHKYDRRGRCYASGYHVNSQGTDYNKAVLQFAKKEMINA